MWLNFGSICWASLPLGVNSTWLRITIGWSSLRYLILSYIYWHMWQWQAWWCMALAVQPTLMHPAWLKEDARQIIQNPSNPQLLNPRMVTPCTGDKMIIKLWRRRVCYLIISGWFLTMCILPPSTMPTSMWKSVNLCNQVSLQICPQWPWLCYSSFGECQACGWDQDVPGCLICLSLRSYLADLQLQAPWWEARYPKTSGSPPW